MPKRCMIFLGRFADGPAKKPDFRRSPRAMTWMAYVSVLLVVMPGLVS